MRASAARRGRTCRLEVTREQQQFEPVRKGHLRELGSHRPSQQTKRPKRRKPTGYRLTRDEAIRMLHTATGVRERRAIYLGLCAGLRRTELRGMQGRHFRREGWVWVSADIGKGRQGTLDPGHHRPRAGLGRPRNPPR